MCIIAYHCKPNISASLLLNNNSRTIDRTNSDNELIKVIDKAYDVLQFIRLTKQLGTAILKSIYQTMFIAFQVTRDYNKSMDLALNANLIPQLENVQTTTLHTIFELFFGDAPGFFKKKYDSNEKDQYVNDFSNFLKAIRAEDQHGKVLSFAASQGKLSQDFWDSIITSYNNNKKYFHSKVFKSAIEDLIKTIPSI